MISDGVMVASSLFWRRRCRHQEIQTCATIIFSHWRLFLGLDRTHATNALGFHSMYLVKQQNFGCLRGRCQEAGGWRWTPYYRHPGQTAAQDEENALSAAALAYWGPRQTKHTHAHKIKMMWPVSDEKGHVRGAAVRIPFTTCLIALVRVQPAAAETLVVRTGPRYAGPTAAGYSVHSTSPHRLTRPHDDPHHHRRSLAAVGRTIGRYLLGLWFCIAAATTASVATNRNNHQQRRYPTKNSSSGENDRAPHQPPSLGLRLMLDDNSMATTQRDDHQLFCHHEERVQMRRMLWAAIGHPNILDQDFNNNMRTRKRIVTTNENNNNNNNQAGNNALECAEFCQNKAYCFVGHVLCPGWQREESSATTAVTGPQERLVSSNSFTSNSIADGIQPHPESVLASVSRGRFLATKRVISGAMKLQCKNAVDTLLTNLKDHAHVFRTPCQRLLQRQVSVACFVL
jgi:hypothetical protein